MLDFLQAFFGMAQFVPHGMCLLWRPDLLFLHGASDFLIAFAYFTIPLVILKAHRLRPDLVGARVARLFAAFITACALSHLAGLVTLWIPAYGIQGVIKLVTAAVSIYTAVELIRLLPAFLNTPGRQEIARKDAEIMRRAFEAEEARLAREKLDEFAYVVAHDLRAPLRGIGNQVQFVHEDHDADLVPAVRDRLDRIAELCRRADALIATLLQYSRIGRVEARETVDTARVLADIMASLREVITERNGRVEVETDLPEVTANPADIDTMFRNLIHNALIYNDAAEPRVSIGFLPLANVGGTPMHDVFYVRDNGIGIALEDQEEVFGMFRRLHRPGAYGNGSGTGAGLAFVRKIVEANGGCIRLESEPGQGTTFYLSLAPARGEAPVAADTGTEGVRYA